jgi:hypothetical protein
MILKPHHNTGGTIRLWTMVFAFLLLANVAVIVGWLAWSGNRNAEARALAKRFIPGSFQTNGQSAIGIKDSKTGNLIWVEYDSDNDGKPDSINYFFQGRVAFNVFLSSNGPPEYGMNFYGPGKSETTWLDKGSGLFVERIHYDSNAAFSGFDLWYKEAWHPMVTNNGHRVVEVDGQYFRMTLTNGIWVPRTNDIVTGSNEAAGL